MINEHNITDKSIYNVKMIEQDLEGLFSTEFGMDNESVITDIADKIKAVAEHLVHKINIINNIESIAKYIQDQQIVFNKEIDKVCLIIDRDPHNFKESQYENVIKICNENGFDLFVSNPCFEFWLLLHSNHVMTISRNRT